MNATTSCPTARQAGLYFGPNLFGQVLSFSTLMRDEAKSIARGLQRRDPDLLDRLIEQYQYRLFRYLMYVTGDKARGGFFPGNLDPRARTRPPIRRQIEI